MMAGWLGADQLAAHQIAINMASTTYMMASGISAAGAIRVGNALGRCQSDSVRRAGVAALWLGTAFHGVVGGCISDGQRLAGQLVHS
jgi:MATE family multidrug resistance protein